MALIWVTGVRGFIGRHLARHLHRAGHSVAGVGHGAWSALEFSAWGLDEWVEGDVGAAALGQLIRSQGRPSAVFHLAGGASVGEAIARPLEDFRRTVASTAMLLEWLRTESPGTRLFAVSSAAVYGADHAGSIPEDGAMRPVSPYGQHKLMMEGLCESYSGTFGLRTHVIRLFSVYGSELRKQLLWDVCRKLSAGAERLELGGTGGELRDWTSVDDVVRAITHIWAAEDAAPATCNAATGSGTRVRDLVTALLREWGAEVEVTFTGKARPGDPRCLVADTRRLNGLGFRCETALTSGVRQYVDWYRREHGA